MPVIANDQIIFKQVEMDGVKSVSKMNVVGAPEGWDSHTLRLFKLAGGGHTPLHQHEWVHINYVTRGKGRLRLGDQVHDISQGDFAFVPPNMEHQFENPYDDEFEFICIVKSDYA